jgi:hypothetical protein
VIAGTVDFYLYENGTCGGDYAAAFEDIPVVAGVAVSNNEDYYTDARTISWKAVFTSSNSVTSGDPSHCETMTVSVLDNDISD